MSTLLRPGGTGGAEGWSGVSVSLGADAEVSGRLSFTEPTRIEGKLKGEVRSTDLLVIGSNAVVEAQIQVRSLVVLGQVRGEVRSAERVEICAGGKLVGDVSTKGLVIADGGTFDGNCTMSSQTRTPSSES